MNGQCDARLMVTFQPVVGIAALLVPNYTAWWQRHMCVNNLPKIVETGGNKTCNLLSSKYNALTTTPPCYVSTFHAEKWLSNGNGTDKNSKPAVLNNNNIIQICASSVLFWFTRHWTNTAWNSTGHGRHKIFFPAILCTWSNCIHDAIYYTYMSSKIVNQC